MIENSKFILEDNKLFTEAIIERINENEKRLQNYMKEQPNFIQQPTFYMYSAIINELYLLLTSYNNTMSIERRKESKKSN